MYKEQFHRIEFGVRIQQETSESFFCEYKDEEGQLNDPKFIYVDSLRQIQLRTFCACKDGEVVVYDTSGTLTYLHAPLIILLPGLYTASGRADCMPSGVSNTGWKQ